MDIQVVRMQVGGKIFGLAIMDVNEIIRPREEIALQGGSGIQIRGKVIRISKILQENNLPFPGETTESSRIVIFERPRGKDLHALKVDEVVDVVTVEHLEGKQFKYDDVVYPLI